MRLSVGAVLARLTEEGLAPADAGVAARAALAPEVADDLPWYMRVAVAGGAWFATSLLLASIFAVLRIQSEAAITAVGGLLVGGGIALRATATSEFLRWGAVAFTLAGLGMLTAGIGGLTDSATLAAAACLVASFVIIWLCRDATLRFLCALAAGGALFAWLVGIHAPYALDLGITVMVLLVACAWRWRLRDRSDEISSIVTPVGYGLVVVLFAALLARTLASTHGSWSMDLGREVGSTGPLATVACTAALVALAWRVLEEHGASMSAPASFATIGGCVALGAGTLGSPGIVAGVAALMLAFDRRNRVLLGMAAIFLLVFGSFFYYSLDTTLLVKSGILAGSGLLLLGVRGALKSA